MTLSERAATGTLEEGNLAQVPPGSARSILLTILGELVRHDQEPVWTSSLLYVLEGMGFEERTARQAINRGATAGWIKGNRTGREVRWELADEGRRLIEQGIVRLGSVGTQEHAWDGRWLTLIISVPQSQRKVRKKLYGALRWAGFGNPAPGVWLTPHLDREDEALSIIKELELSASTLSFSGPTRAIGLSDQQIVGNAWNLEDTAQAYESLIARYSKVVPHGADELLFTHLALVNEWQRIPFMDPQLPTELMPDWAGAKASELVSSLRAEWTQPARARWQEICRKDPAAG
ncbi:PaaX family transcriptional regulator [Arthrobacter globiformis]|uniref:PaaX family transcriptional regulator n=1 Tax=Arthrobacter globiformis TaxID=1665 RepID=UPI0027943C25|nr:PaaX family transcriptional regulator C-terminal domain-containing protein [Arthrobacter globiformis]MDQ0616702.1 phenylacetic acid degradation operon negative regulatory protein [Arthrobacter globiformis]